MSSEVVVAGIMGRSPPGIDRSGKIETPEVKVTGYRRACLRVRRSQHVSNKVKCNISKPQNVKN